jgi:Tfp pilus assembly protein PilO
MVTASLPKVGSDRRKLLTLGGALVVFSVLFYGQWIRPLMVEVTRLRDGIAVLETETKSAVTARGELERSTRLYKERQARLNGLKVLLPTAGDGTEIIRQIHDLAATSGLRVKSLTPQQRVSRDFYDAQYLTLVVQGGYHHLGLFFQELSEADWISNLESFELKAVDSCVGDCSLSASCRLTLFYVPEDVALSGK